MMVTAANALAEKQGVYSGMVLADARAIIPALQVFDHVPGLADRLTYKFFFKNGELVK